MAKGVRYTEEFRELPLQALEQFRGGARVADDGREPEDGQRFPSCVVEDRRRRRPSDRGTVLLQCLFDRFGSVFP